MTSRVWAVHENQQAELRLYENKTWPLHTGGGKPGQGYPLVMQVVPFVAFDSNWSGQYAMTNDGSMAPTLKTGGAGGNPPAVESDSRRIDGRLILRRLTPLECERLMGWPDGWTEHGVTDDGTTVDIAITQRYRICGNGIVSNVTQWLGERLNDITGGVNNG